MRSVRKAPRTGHWEARYRDPGGRQRTATFARKGEALAFVAATETEIGRGGWIDPTLARREFGDWAREWRSTIVHQEPNTIAFYDTMLRCHVLPALADTSAGSLDKPSVRRFVADLVAAGAGPRTVQGAFQTMRHVLATAVEAGALRANPCDGVKVPRLAQRECVFLTADQVGVLSRALT
ncbi:MAG: hypothetical protein ACRD2W_25615 [Acidimicrobiales bacterium]